MSGIFSAITGAFSGLTSKLMLGLLIAAAAIAFFFYTDNNATQAKLDTAGKALTTANVQLTSLQADFKNLQSQVQTLQSAEAVTDKTQGAVASETIVANDKAVVINQKVEDKVNAIEKKYSVLPATPDNKVAQDKEVSVQRIQGLWDVFCVAAPTDANCKPPGAVTAPPVTTAASVPAK